MGKHKLKKSKKHHRKQSSSSSEDEEWIEADLVQEKQKSKETKKSRKRYSSSSSDSSTEKRKKRKNIESSFISNDELKKKLRKSKKKSKEKHRSNEPADINSYARDTSNEYVNDGIPIVKNDEKNPNHKREEWMDLSTTFSSLSNVDKRRQKEEEKKLKKESEQYDPSKCSRELNPYWKDGGDGLPKFQKPKFDHSDEDNDRKYKSKNTFFKESNWRKKKYDSNSSEQEKISQAIDSVDKQRTGDFTKEESHRYDNSITQKDLNLIAGKLVKAEIMGNEKLVNELKEKLENARESLLHSKSQVEEVLLTQSDRQGHSKPLTLQDKYGESSNSNKKRKTVMDTHQEKHRVRYFPDDDKYSLKQMFENEKYNTSNNGDSEFMKIASNIRKNDDLDEYFADNVRRKKSDSKIDDNNRSKAIKEHKHISRKLDNCSKCIQSDTMQKHLIISIGEYSYLTLPPHEPLTEGHCLIVPIRHVSSATQLDENEWSEIMDFRKSLVRLVQTKSENFVFFEIACGFHKYPHMIIECIPLPKGEGDMAPIYFKKAIDESETEWAQNKKLVSLKGRDVRRAIPKGLPYFSVSFGMEEGFAHVIEDEKLFPTNFAQEIIGGMLDLHHSRWRKPSRQSFNDQSKRVLEFSNHWKNFDFTHKT